MALLTNAQSQTLRQCFYTWVGALMALIVLNCSDWPHLGPPWQPLLIGPGMLFKLRLGPQVLVWAMLWEGVGLQLGYAVSWWWTLLIQTPMHRLTSWPDLGYALPLWTCLAITGSDLWIGFLVWPQICLIIMDFYSDLDSQLKLAALISLHCLGVVDGVLVGENPMLPVSPCKHAW